MTKVYTLAEQDAQRQLEAISWRPLAYMFPAREAKRKEAEEELKRSMVDV